MTTLDDPFNLTTKCILVTAKIVKSRPSTGEVSLSDFYYFISMNHLGPATSRDYSMPAITFFSPPTCKKWSTQKCCSSPSKSSSRLMAFIQGDGLCFLSGQRSNEPREDFRSVIVCQTAKIKLAFFFLEDWQLWLKNMEKTGTGVYIV